MTCWFVSRHPAALAWARQQQLPIDRFVPHLQTTLVQPGDHVIGTLPINLVAEINARGASFDFLVLDLPSNLRGRELDLAAMQACRARLERYCAQSLGPSPLLTLSP